MHKRFHFLIYLSFILLPSLFFYKIFTGNTIVVGDFTGSDLLDLHLPFKFALHKNLTSGHLPLWEPNLSLGFPLFAEGQSGTLFPTNFLLSFINPADALNLSILSVFAISSVGTYFYLRLLKKNRLTAFFASCVFAFSAFFITRLKHLNLITTASLFPYLLITAKLYFDRKNNLYLILTGIVIALQIFAGHPQMTFYNLFIFAIYIAFESFKAYRQKEPDASVISRGVTLITLSTLIGFLLSAIQLLPTLELVNLSSRRSLSKATLTAYPFHPKNLITFVSPYYFGNPASATYTQDIRWTGIFWENSSYIGMLPFILALVAIIQILRKRDRNPYNKFFLLLSLFSVLLMLGPFTPLFPAFLDNLPLFNLFRFPTRFNLYLIFSLAVLSSNGLTLIIDKIEQLRSKTAAQIEKKTESDEYRFNWPLDKSKTSILIIAFTLLDFFVFAKAYIGYLPKAKLFEKPEYIEKLKSDSTYYRIFSTTQYLDSPYQALGWVNDADPILISRKAMPPNNNILFDIPSFTDRAWFEGGLGLETRNRIEQFILYENTDQVLIGKVLGMYSVKYIFSFADYLGIEIYEEDNVELGHPFALPLKIFRNDQVIPRAYVVPEAVYIDDENDILNHIKSSDFLPTKTVLLATPPQELPAEFQGALNDFKEANTVEITSASPNRVNLKTNIKQHSFLVLNDVYYPGWKAKVDNQEQKILKANYLVRSLELNPGEHQIVFYYDPLSFRIGSIISAATAALLVIITLATGIKNFQAKYLKNIRRST